MSVRSTFWLAWSVCALSLALTALAILLLILNLSHPNAHIYDYWVQSTATAVAYSTLGALVASRRPEHPVGWLFWAIGFIAGAAFFFEQYAVYALLAQPGALPAGEAAAWIRSLLPVIAGGLGVFLLLLFPDGRLPSVRWKYLAWFNATEIFLGLLWVATSPGPIPGLGPIPNPLGIDSLDIAGGLSELPLRGFDVPWAIVVLLATTSVFVRLHGAGVEERQQIKWLAYAAVLLTSAVVLRAVTGVIPVPASVSVAIEALIALSLVGVAAAAAVAVLKYRLYDIDLVINRTLVYGSLTASVAAIYVAAVGALGVLFQSSGTLLNSLVGTGIVAIVFAPLRDRLQRGVNRLMYGDRDDPYAVISRLGQRLEATLEPRAILPTIVETVAHALKLPYVAISLKESKNPAHKENGSEHGREDGFVEVASCGSPVEYQPLRLPLSFGHETIGEFILAPRARGEHFSPADWRLLEDLARQTEVAAYAVRLTDDLQRARERLVSTREEERRRLRRDLHDGLGPQLSGQALTIDAIRSLLRRDPAAAEELLVDLKVQTRRAASDIRRLVYALRPPALDSLGLVSALRKRAAQCEHDGTLRVHVEAPDELPPLPAAVEVACYRIGEEALTNVVRHAQAQKCSLSFAIDEGWLRLEVCDDGRGLPVSRTGESRRAGVGLTSMRERATELGGRLVVAALPEEGTVVRAELPLPEEG